ncbi:hypothetical protein C2S53_015080 [Perilla frutescens var. hirtella]|uniref:Uncharacterized protein n=1 Tax=Perilla frutescens var. hirtella TaxID=608512 RepID=A0AAD4JCZ5_PERFH|nr:hypothetical protein C2S53_015080 [Perilla frutescens var. hirtella]
MHATYLASMMGCNVSKFGAGGRANFQARLRPLFLQGLAGVRTWRLLPRPAKDTPSKKGLLLHDKENPSFDQNDPKKSVAMATVIGNNYGIKVTTKRPNLRLKDKSHTKDRPITADKSKKSDASDEDEDDDQGRKIGAFPGSPSFRIFFQDAAVDDGHNQIGDTALSKEICVQKKVKRERKKRPNIKTVMSGKRREAGIAVKNLLNVKACSHSPHNSTLSVADTRKSGH